MTRAAAIALGGVVVAIVVSVTFSRIYVYETATPGLVSLFALVGLLISLIGCSVVDWVIRSRTRPSSTADRAATDGAKPAGTAKR
jgi:xanthosine utilization system XapX-like protein